MPVGFGVVLVAVVLPCGNFVGEYLLVGDAAIQTLRREGAEGKGPSIYLQDLAPPVLDVPRAGPGSSAG